MEGEEYWLSGQFEPERAAVGPYTISISATKNYATNEQERNKYRLYAFSVFALRSIVMLATPT